MTARFLGLHHVTAIVDDPQENVDFYTTVLGLRLIKQTVNFDDPYTYHLYYGDAQGRPGSIVTFFPWPRGRRGSRGTGQTSAMAFGVPADSLDYWSQRLEAFGIRSSLPETRFGNSVLSLYDPAGLLIELVAQPTTEAVLQWTASPVAPAAAIRGLVGVTLTLAENEASSALLTTTLGFRPLGVEGKRHRYELADAEDRAYVDLISRPDVPRGSIAVGSIHHVAWRVADDAQQAEWRLTLEQAGQTVTPVRDRRYFHSIYFHEPGGALFEIATDPPGFTVDERAEELGQTLMLPPWLEAKRGEITAQLLPITLPPSNVAPQQAAER